MSAEPTPKRSRVYRGVLGASLLSLAVGGLALVTVSTASAEANKVTLCHATGSEDNPYVSVTVDDNAVLNGHGDHSGDIIPAFDYNGGSYGGKNLGGDGSAILANGCQAVEPSPSTSTATETATQTAEATETATETATATATETVTATALPAVSESPTVIPTAEAGGNGPNAGGSGTNNQGGTGTTTGGDQGATGPLAANAGGGSESGGGSPTWALALLGAGVAGTAISSLGLARKQ